MVIASQTDGIWTRRNVTPNASGGGKGTATEIADKDGLYDGQATVAMAVDPNGFHHVVWSTPSGLYYAQDSKIQLQGNQTTLAFNGAPTQIVKTAASGASIAVSDDGTPWVAFIADGKVEVASLSGSTWTVQDVDQAAGTPSPANRTAITVVSGNPIVAYPGASGVTVATRPSTAPTPGAVTTGGWSTSTVPSSSGALGLSMTPVVFAAGAVLHQRLRGRGRGRGVRRCLEGGQSAATSGRHPPARTSRRSRPAWGRTRTGIWRWPGPTWVSSSSRWPRAP